MKAKTKFREGWIMLLRPFAFAELSKPLQKMTILYAYSEKPMVSYELNTKGREEMAIINDHYGKTSIVNHHKVYSKRHFENEEAYEIRMDSVIDKVIRDFGTEEVYKGELVQCIVEGEICKFYPEEYNVISRETFDHILTCDPHEYIIEVEDNSFFELKDVKNKIFYTQTRGIKKEKAMQMNSNEAKDAVIFRPGPAILEMFCRSNEIY